MNLRPYQTDAINMVRNSFHLGKRVVLCLPTGAGKTVVFSEIARQTQSKNKKVLICTHRKELLKQALKNSTAEVMMVETLNNKLKNDSIKLNDFDLLIIDEAHIGNFRKILDGYNGFVIGATATPISKPNMKNLYDSIVCNIDIPNLIEQGYLSTPRTYLKKAVDVGQLEIKMGEYTDKSLNQVYNEKKVYEGVVKDYLEKFRGKKAIVFCCNIAHSKNTYNEFINHGVNAFNVDSKMSSEERDKVMLDFTASDNGVLTNCSIATTGFDVPDIELVIVNRATKSLALWLQMCGRGSRVTNTKKSFSILDYGENIIRLGHWEAERDWHYIFNEPEKVKKEQPAPLKDCPQCQAVCFASARVCPYCNWTFDVKSIELSKGELIEIVLKKCEGKKISKLSLNELLEVANKKKWKQQFVERVLYHFNYNDLNIFWDNKKYKDQYRERRLSLFSMEKPINDFNIKY